MVARRRGLNRLGFFGLSLVAFATGLAGTASGCGDSEGKKGPDQVQPGTDASQVGSEGGVVGEDSSAAVTIDIQTAAVTVYAGQLAQIVASQSKASDGSPLTFAWNISSVPNGSTITNSSLGGGNELISFTPDIAGDYVLKVTAQAGSVTATKDVTVKAVNAPVFYVKTVSGANSVDEIGYEMRTVQMDGTGDHAVACRQPTFKHLPFKVFDSGTSSFTELFEQDAGDGGPGGLQMAGFANYFYMSLFADQAMDWWEAPADQPSHAAFQDLVPLPDAGADADAATMRVSLFIATQDNSCQNQPFAARTFDGKESDSVWQPKFSPDGRRIAFIESHGDQPYLVTTAIDGSDLRRVAPYCADKGKDCFKQYMFPRRPQWIDETHVGWMRTTTEFDKSTGVIGWEIMVAPDLDTATVSRYMSCTSGTAPLLFNFLRNGDILTGLAASAKGAEDLVVLGRNNAGACHVVRNLTNLMGGDGSYARDFQISPDGTMVAYMQKLADGKDAGLLDIRQGGHLFIVPLDGTKPPEPVGGVMRTANYGPRWIAGGTLLAWNGNAPPPPGYDAGLFDPGFDEDDDSGTDAAAFSNAFLEAGLPSMNVVRPDGGGFVAVAFGNPAQGEYVLGGGNGGSCTLQCNGLGCTPQCDQQSLCNPQTNCAVADRDRGATGAMFWGSIFGLVLFARRSRRKVD